MRHHEIMGKCRILLITAILLLCVVPVGQLEASERAPLVRRQGEPTGVYIVRLKSRAPEAIEGQALSIAASYDGHLRYIFDHALGGFSLAVSPENVERMREDPRIAFVEEDVRIRWDIGDGGLSTTLYDTKDPSTGEYLWYLDRIDEYQIDPSTNKLDGWYNYYHCDSFAANVTAYIIDQGVNGNARHLDGSSEFGSRVSSGVDIVDPDAPKANRPCLEGPDANYGWHGTAVASVLGGNKYGVAKDVRIVPIRAVECNGDVFTERIIAAFNWIISPTPVDANGPEPGGLLPVNPAADPNSGIPLRPAVVNFSGYLYPQERSLDANGNPYTASIELAARDVVAAGLSVITSADNFNRDACRYAPNNIAYGGPDAIGIGEDGQQVTIPAGDWNRVISVGGTMWGQYGNFEDPNDYRWQQYQMAYDDPIPIENLDGAGSNWGPCVSIYAPAKTIPFLRHDGVHHSGNGTSFAAPQVAGAAALYLAERPGDAPISVWSHLESQATKAVIGGSGKKILFIGGEACRRRSVRHP